MNATPLSDGTGVLIRHSDIASQFIPTRPVDVWLPPAAAAGARLPVLYMHDGQNIFDPALSFAGVDWGVDEAMLRLIEATGLPGAIVVGIWNDGVRRRQEYTPAGPLEAREGNWPNVIRAAGEPAESDKYLRFIVEELKPLIDGIYPTRTGAQDTFVMGSSLGGLISLHAVEMYPDVFGAAGCVSTHWPIGGDAMVDAMAAALPPPSSHRLYFDYGTETTDAAYEPLQQRMDEHLQAAGYREGVDWMTRKFDGAEHSERSWRERVDIPLRFLLFEK